MLILGVDQHSTCKGSGRITLDNVDPGGHRSTLNLERIHEDFGRITSDNVDPGGPAVEKDF